MKCNNEIRFESLYFDGRTDLSGIPSKTAGRFLNPSRKFCFCNVLAGVVIMNCYSQNGKLPLVVWRINASSRCEEQTAHNLTDEVCARARSRSNISFLRYSFIISHFNKMPISDSDECENLK
jgi:hypothetical protein